MGRWCDLLVRLGAPLVPYDIRRDWLREWRAELAFMEARAAQRGRGLPGGAVWRAAGAIAHAAWLRWDRWRIDMIWQDVKHSLRALRAKPGFSFVTVLTLAIGIGGNAAIFSAVNAVLLRPLPYPEPDRLMRVYKTTLTQPNRVGGTVSPPDFTDWRHDNTTFSEMGAFDSDTLSLTGSGAAEQLPVGEVSGGFFAVMGTPASLGRVITPDDDPMGARDVVVLSHALWTRRFGSDRAILGRHLTIDGTAREVVGVMPPGFQYPLQSEFWVPLKFSAQDLQTQRGAHYIQVVGRLKPGVDIEQARTEMRAVAARLARDFPRTNRDRSASVHPLREAMVGNVRQSMFVLFGAVGLVLLIVCVNVAGLVLIRAVGRGRELAVRVAVGAGRFSLIRGLLVETVILGLAGGAVGLLLAYWATAAISSLDPSVGVPLLNQTRLDTTVVLFTLGISVIASVLFGTMPAWQASSLAEVLTRIREDGGSTTSDPKRQRTRSVMVVAQTTIAVVLLVGAGLLTRSFARLLAVELGFDGQAVQTFTLELPANRYAQPLQRQEFVETLLSRIAANPGVESVGATSALPLSGSDYSISTSTRDGIQLSDDDQDRLTMEIRIVTPGYFKTMGIPVTRGRAFTGDDRRSTPPVAIVSASAAALVWPELDPLGHHLEIGTRFGMGGARAGGTIVGVAGDVRDDGPATRPRPTLYLAHAQWPVGSMTVTARARVDPSALIEPMRRVMVDLDPDVPMFAVRSMPQIAAIAVAQPRLYMVLLLSFAATALLLAAIGLYGVLAYAVGQRTREIGIRLALGAKRAEVLRMIMGQAGRLAVTGIVAGLAAAALASRLLRSQLFEVTPTDTMTYVAVAIGLMTVALIASWIPARRATRIDPISALRHD